VLVASVDEKPCDTEAPSCSGTGQEAQASEDVAPSVDEKVPAGHDAVHVTDVRPAVVP
jgi:hypothetical protein